MTDEFTPYEISLNQLLERLSSDRPRYADVLVYQQRLQENIIQARKYGDTEALKHERAQIVDKLNPLAFEIAGVSFLDLGNFFSIIGLQLSFKLECAQKNRNIPK